LDSKYQLNERQDSALAEEVSAPAKGKEPITQKDDVSGEDAFLRWKNLTFKQWSDQDTRIGHLEEQRASLRTDAKKGNGADRPRQKSPRNPLRDEFVFREYK
jgi:hypothetical protein